MASKTQTGSTLEIREMMKDKVPVTMENWLNYVYADGDRPENPLLELDVPIEVQEKEGLDIP